MTGREMLCEYLRAKGLETNVNEIEIGPFGDSPEMAAKLLRLILAGQKRATCWACLSEEPPAPGELCAVTGWKGEAGCIVETVRAQVLPFGRVTWELARLEGENDCLQEWKAEHERFFRAEAAREGYEFSENMPVIFEEFRVIWPERYADHE